MSKFVEEFGKWDRAFFAALLLGNMFTHVHWDQRGAGSLHFGRR